MAGIFLISDWVGGESTPSSPRRPGPARITFAWVVRGRGPLCSCAYAFWELKNSCYCGGGAVIFPWDLIRVSYIIIGTWLEGVIYKNKPTILYDSS